MGEPATTQRRAEPSVDVREPVDDALADGDVIAGDKRGDLAAGDGVAEVVHRQAGGVGALDQRHLRVGVDGRDAAARRSARCR